MYIASHKMNLEELADLPHTERIKQNEGREKYVPNKITRLNLRKRTKEIKIRSLLDKELTLMVLNMINRESSTHQELTERSRVS